MQVRGTTVLLLVMLPSGQGCLSKLVRHLLRLGSGMGVEWEKKSHLMVSDGV